MTGLEEALARAEGENGKVKEERDKAQLALKKVSEELKAKEEQWANEAQVRRVLFA